jgi:hypothetical protein
MARVGTHGWVGTAGRISNPRNMCGPAALDLPACYGALLLHIISFVFLGGEKARIENFLASRVCGRGGRVYMAMAPSRACRGHCGGI